MLNKWHLRSFGLASGAVLSLFWAARVHADAPTGQYTIANGTVYDTKSKLTWQQTAENTQLTSANAKTYCEGLMLDGSGWRLPSANEIMSIVDEARYDPAIDTNAFPGAMPNKFWTSSPNNGNPPQMWAVDFYNGITISSNPGSTYRARCVR